MDKAFSSNNILKVKKKLDKICDKVKKQKGDECFDPDFQNIWAYYFFGALAKYEPKQSFTDNKTIVHRRMIATRLGVRCVKPPLKIQK